MMILHVRSATLLPLMGLLTATVALAVPPLPMRAYGMVAVDGGNVPDGTLVSAICDGEIYGFSITSLIDGQSVYSLFISGDDPNTPEREGCLIGNTVSFVITLGGLDLIAGETATWVSGDVANINLTAQSPVSSSPSPRPSFVLHENSPNPFNPRTTIAFDMPSEQPVSLRVYDIAGRLVDTVLNEEQAATGRNEVVWQGRDENGQEVPAGVYFYRLDAGAYSEAKRMTMVK